MSKQAAGPPTVQEGPGITAALRLDDRRGLRVTKMSGAPRLFPNGQTFLGEHFYLTGGAGSLDIHPDKVFLIPGAAAQSGTGGGLFCRTCVIINLDQFY